jgi:recombinational DNA repair protein (RecF pathway)
MHEYVTRAVVLEKNPMGEYDMRVSLFSEKLGKIEARARSARKILSKLSAHLEPGTLSIVRIVENRGMHIADALKAGTTGLTIRDLEAVNRLVAAHQKDAALWNVLSGNFSWARALTALGWDPQHGACAQCKQAPVGAFYIENQEFYCPTCLISLGVSQNELVYM